MSNLTLTDRYGDEIDIENDTCTVYIKVTEGGNTSEVAFTPGPNTVAIAEAIHPVHRVVQSVKQQVDSPGDFTAASQEAVKASGISLNEALLRLAIIHGLEAEFRYAKGSGSVIETRHLKPEAIRGNGKDRRFVGQDPDRDAPRGFRLDRIKGTVRLVVA